MKRLSEGIYPGLFVAIVIMVLMGMPGRYFPTVVCFWDWLGPDKIVHIILFALFAFVSAWGYRKKILTSGISLKRTFLLTFLITISYGALTEILQKYLFINRYGSFYDLIADAIGCLLGSIVLIFYFKNIFKKINKTKNNI